MASDLIILQNHSVESGGSNLINDFGMLMRLAIHADPAKHRFQVNNEGTIVISRNQFLSSQYSTADLQERGLYLTIVGRDYMSLIDGSRVHISADAVE